MQLVIIDINEILGELLPFNYEICFLEKIIYFEIFSVYTIYDY
jgi:hypothetical protein